MNKFKLTLLAAAIAPMLFFSVAFVRSISAQTAPSFRGGDIFTATNNTKQSPNWTDPLTNVDPQNVVQFRINIANDGGDVAHNTHVQVGVPSGSGTTLVPTVTISSSNASSVSDTATIVSDTGGAFAFTGLVPNDTIEFSSNCPNGCPLPDTIIGSGIDLGDVAPVATANNINITFKLYTQPAAAPSPSPSPSPSVSPSPSPSPSVSPSPSPSPSASPAVSQTCAAGQVQVGINQQGTIICQNISSSSSSNSSATGGSVTIDNSGNQTQTVNTPAVAGVSTTAAKSLPKTGLPELAWGLIGLLPVGAKLKGAFGQKGDLEDHPTFLFEQREFKRGA